MRPGITFSPNRPDRFAAWLVYAAALVVDMMATVSGQSDYWWSGMWLAASERNPAVEHLLQRGPALVAVFCLLCLTLAYFLSRLLPARVGVALALLFACGHALAAHHWFAVHSGQVVAGCLLAGMAVIALAGVFATIARGRTQIGLTVGASILFVALGAGTAAICATRFDRSATNEPDVVAARLMRAGAIADADSVASGALDDPRLGPTARFNAHMAVARVAAMRCERDRLGRHLEAAIKIARGQSDGPPLVLGFANEEGARLLLSVGDTGGAREKFLRAAEAFELMGARPGVENAAEWKSRAAEAYTVALALEP